MNAPLTPEERKAHPSGHLNHSDDQED